MKRNFSKTLVNIVLLLGLLVGQAASAPTPLTVESFLSELRKANDSLEDVWAKATLDLNIVLGILPYTEHLKGTYFYLNPNKHRLEFQDAPSYFDKAPSMFSWKLPSQEKYRAEIAGPIKQGAGEVYQLLFRPKAHQSSTLSITCTFDVENLRLRQQKTVYRDGGSVDLKFSYWSDSELPVIDRVSAAVAIPTYALTGSAIISFSDQAVNKGLDSEVFGPEQEQE